MGRCLVVLLAWWNPHFQSRTWMDAGAHWSHWLLPPRYVGDSPVQPWPCRASQSIFGAEGGRLLHRKRWQIPFRRLERLQEPKGLQSPSMICFLQATPPSSQWVCFLKVFHGSRKNVLRYSKFFPLHLQTKKFYIKQRLGPNSDTMLGQGHLLTV